MLDLFWKAPRQCRHGNASADSTVRGKRRCRAIAQGANWCLPAGVFAPQVDNPGDIGISRSLLREARPRRTKHRYRPSPAVDGQSDYRLANMTPVSKTLFFFPLVMFGDLAKFVGVLSPLNLVCASALGTWIVPLTPWRNPTVGRQRRRQQQFSHSAGPACSSRLRWGTSSFHTWYQP